ncbi:hypothetical protein AcetOrient_orf02799 [Acetobacter orientalis]|uniref:Uncharacterized protein n=1 Tax=Acetobacter orientalis TaxID=146474 RepID=A0A2Z5ZHI9_9PROT|nr:hypothetical protein AcetOrient_orf02799 [Acetobacter orientalis]
MSQSILKQFSIFEAPFYAPKKWGLTKKARAATGAITA